MISNLKLNITHNCWQIKRKGILTASIEPKRLEQKIPLMKYNKLERILELPPALIEWTEECPFNAQSFIQN